VWIDALYRCLDLWRKFWNIFFWDLYVSCCISNAEAPNYRYVDYMQIRNEPAVLGIYPFKTHWIASFIWKFVFCRVNVWNARVPVPSVALRNVLLICWTTIVYRLYYSLLPARNFETNSVSKRGQADFSDCSLWMHTQNNTWNMYIVLV
jgi:hypothetical protein